MLLFSCTHMHTALLESAGCCTDMPTVLLASAAHALTFLVLPLPHCRVLHTQANCFPGIYRHTQPRVQGLSCASAGTSMFTPNAHLCPLQHQHSLTHIPILPYVSTCTPMPTAPLCPQQARAHLPSLTSQLSHLQTPASHAHRYPIL